MKCFPNKSLSNGFGWLVVAGLAAFVAPAALAQVSDGEADAGLAEQPLEAPRSILPDPTRPGPVLVSPNAGVNHTPAGPVGYEAEMQNDPAEPGNAVEEAVGSIEIGSLDQVDPSSVGLIDQASGGFGLDMWAGSSRPFIEQLIPNLPGNISSVQMQDLQKRLLVSAAVVPEGPVGTPSLLTLRLKALARSGDLVSVLELLNRLPPELSEPELKRLQADAYLLGGELSNACSVNAAGVSPAESSSDTDSFWLRLSGYCRLLEGNVAGAGLVVELLQDQGINVPLYYRLMARLMSGDLENAPAPAVEPIDQITPLTLNMLTSAGLAVPQDLLPVASPLMMQALATMPNLAIEVRVEAAEKAARNGTLPAERLAEIYAAIPVDPAELTSVAILADAEFGVRANAVLYQKLQATGNTDIAGFGEALKVLQKRAAMFDMSLLQAKVNAQAIAAVEPSAESMRYAREITRSLLMAGRHDRVNDWYNFIRSIATAENIDATEALITLWPLKVVTDAEGMMPWSPEILELWWNSQLSFGFEERRDRASLLYSVLEALGYEVPEVAWNRLAAGDPGVETPQPALPYWRALLRAAEKQRLGETVLLVLISLDNEGLGKVSPVIFGNVIRSLRAVGLDHEARGLALEALISKDF